MGSPARVAPVLLTAPLGPDLLTGVGPVVVAAEDGRDVVRAASVVAPWMVGPDGTPSAGALGVLLDAVLGQAILLPRPVDGWAVTTEIGVDFTAPLPPVGTPIAMDATVVAADAEGSLARGTVVAADGTVLAVATEWGKVVPGVPDLDVGVPPVAPSAARSVTGMLGAEAADGVLSVPGSPALANERETVHGGILLTASEVAAVAALPATAERPFVTGSVRICYLRPAPTAGPTRYRTRTVHAGRSFGVVEVEAHTPDGRLATVATVTRRVV